MVNSFYKKVQGFKTFANACLKKLKDNKQENFIVGNYNVRNIHRYQESLTDRS